MEKIENKDQLKELLENKLSKKLELNIHETMFIIDLIKENKEHFEEDDIVNAIYIAYKYGVLKATK